MCVWDINAHPKRVNIWEEIKLFVYTFRPKIRAQGPIFWKLDLPPYFFTECGKQVCFLNSSRKAASIPQKRKSKTFVFFSEKNLEIKLAPSKKDQLLS